MVFTEARWSYLLSLPLRLLPSIPRCSVFPLCCSPPPLSFCPSFHLPSSLSLLSSHTHTHTYILSDPPLRCCWFEFEVMGNQIGSIDSRNKQLISLSWANMDLSQILELLPASDLWQWWQIEHLLTVTFHVCVGVHAYVFVYLVMLEHPSLIREWI